MLKNLLYYLHQTCRRSDAHDATKNTENHRRIHRRDRSADTPPCREARPVSERSHRRTGGRGLETSTSEEGETTVHKKSYTRESKRPMTTQKSTPSTTSSPSPLSSELDRLRAENVALRTLASEALALLGQMANAYWQQQPSLAWVEPLKALQARAQAMGIEEG